MRNHGEDVFLISMLVNNKDRQKELLERALGWTIDYMPVLDILKSEGYITLGNLEEEEICIEPEDSEFVDELLHDYFNYLKNEWTVQM